MFKYTNKIVNYKGIRTHVLVMDYFYTDIYLENV